MNEFDVLIDDINNVLKDFCDCISKDHHKNRDGIWYMHFDVWNEKWNIYHHGYILDEIEVKNENLIEGLKEFRKRLLEKLIEKGY